ncbi:hypothetical protein ACFYVW_05525 [Streptomyces tendae]|uniref:hypothetical protein n=1 Tax=Streptomyces tendae TaxID=1932 RepID=UPI0036893A9B
MGVVKPMQSIPSIYPFCAGLVKILFMDQGVAAVWAAGVAGFASAAGAAVGASLTARGARSQVLQQGKVDFSRQRREEFKENCTAFQAKLREALFALEESQEALRDAVSTQASSRLRQAVLSVHTGHFDHVMTYTSGALVNVSAEALDRLQGAARALDALRRNPAEAVPDSPPYLHWLDQYRSYLGAYEMFCKEVQRVSVEAWPA